ncbi:hypothetical protein JY651_07845 [Pyxidicoccus parkwayensis]|uniref:DUF3892 domain-containing protein n=1 Tax=Pyxidicoccus parkwayensis TaxID=2813578 RepID=A0ABX7P302_9BACT|nr:hypothetical protein [Pyxidicoccus parkwaysis]QSQ24842.1 hypothetical protein JY651_07845 [Pyxidicoccus parkwaysis]
MDYLITGTRNNMAGTRIEYYEVRAIVENKAAAPSLWSMPQVAAAILNGNSFTTATWSPLNKAWLHGALVEVTLRSHSDGTLIDNLNKLPKV